MTNLPAPYRLPLWRRLSEQIDLRVVLLAQTEPGRHWQWPQGEPYEMVLVESLALPHGETRLYLPSWRLLKQTRDADLLVIGGWDFPAYQALLLWARYSKVPTAVFYASTIESQRFRTGPFAKVRSWMFRSAAAVIALGPDAADAVSVTGVCEDRIIETVNTVDVGWFASETSRCRESVAAATDFLYVGQLIARKNVDGLLRALAALPESPTLSLIGDGPELSALQRLADELGVSERVRFLGHLGAAELPAAFAAHQTLVLPSTEEVWGLVVNEALAAGLQVIVSSRCGVARAVREMPGVWVCEPDPGDLTETMAAARMGWTGPVSDPPILRHTPEAMAEAVLARLLPLVGATHA